MVYYPLQLLQLAGIGTCSSSPARATPADDRPSRDGHLTVRDGDEPLLELDLSYKVQTRPGGSPRSSAWPRTSQPATRRRRARRQHLRYSHADEIAAWGARGEGARCSSRTCPTRRTSASSSTTRPARWWISRRRPASSTCATRRADERCRGRALLLPGGRLLGDREPGAVEPRELEITDVNRHTPSGERSPSCRCAAGGKTPEALAAPRGDRPHDRRDGREQVSVDGIERIPLRRFETIAAGSASSAARASCRTRPCRRTSRSRAAA